MVNVFKHTLYCMGEGYLNKHTYGDAVAREQATQRLNRDMIESLMRSARHAEAARNWQTAVLNRQQIRPQNFQQMLALALARPVMAFARMLQRLPQLPLPLPAFVKGAAAKLGNRLNQAMGNMLAFFFGFKKKNDRVEERKQRNDTEIPDQDQFTRFVVEESSESMLNGER